MSEIPFGYCQCGCGQKTNLADQTMSREGYQRGEPRRFIHGHSIKKINQKLHTRTLAERFWAKVNKRGENECWEWQGANRGKGYGSFRVDSLHTQPSSRVAWTLTHGTIPDGLFVCHKCDNPPCCNPAHLFLGTNRDNVLDAESKHRIHHPAGEHHGMAELTADDVREIRRLAASGAVHLHIAKQFGITNTHVGRIVKRECWKNI